MSTGPIDPCSEAEDSCGGARFDLAGPGGGRGRRLLLEAAVLAALAEHPCTHGYGLRRSLARLTNGFAQLSSGNIYRLLRRLEDDGYVTSAWAEGGFGPQRRQYRLTPAGYERLFSCREDLEARERAFRAVIDAIDRCAAPTAGAPGHS